MTPADVRQRLVDAIRLDLVGPDDDDELLDDMRALVPHGFVGALSVETRRPRRLLELNKQYAEEEKAQHQESQLDKDVQFALQAPIAATKKKAAPKATKKKASD